MSADRKYAEIILPLALRQSYTYSIPESMQGEIQPGKRVALQFGKRKIYTGIVYFLHNDPPSGTEIKPIDHVLDEKPVVNEKQLKLWEWMADYYMCTMGEIFKAALPHGLKLESESRLICNNDYVDKSILEKEEKLLYEYLEKEKGLTLHKLGKNTRNENIHQHLQKLINKKAVFVEETLKESYVPVRKIYFRLAEHVTENTKSTVFEKHLSRSAKQRELINYFLDLKRGNALEIKQKEIPEKFSTAIINALVKKKLLIKEEKEVLRSQEFNGSLRKPYQLDAFQQAGFQSIEEQFREKDVVLLHGVTSSGKTEIYIDLINKTIGEGKQVLYLLPEIALTSQIVERLREVFGKQIGVFHSKFNDSERVDVFRRQIEGEGSEYKLILGVRSAVFLPFRKLGLVIVDEEHENTFKQFDPAPRYHARDTAIVLAGLFGAKVLLGTATPSVESTMNARYGKYGFVELKQRYGGVMLPEIRVADLRKARLKKEMRSVFTPLLIRHMQEALENKKQVILFQNRRGYSSYFECEDCGEIPKCNKCDVSLTYHRFENRLVCHYCGYSENIPQSCKACKSTRLTTRGFGTELVEDEIELIFPGTRIARLDLDTTRSRRSYDKILGTFSEGKTDVLVGTQMLSKGLDFDRVALVGILNADQMLNFPDFRAFERSFQLMSQVSGRAGRKKERGMVIIQASDPEHPVIRQVMNNDYNSFYAEQAEERQVFKYPPFVKMIRLVIKSHDFRDGQLAARILGDDLRKTFGSRVLGPQVPVVGRIKNQYLQHILLKIERNSSFKKARGFLREILEDFSSRQEFKKVRVNVDVDPF